MAIKPIEIGQRFQEVAVTTEGLRRSEWQVDRLFVGSDKIDYAALVLASDSTRRKTLSLSILRDARRWKTVK